MWKCNPPQKLTLRSERNRYARYIPRKWGQHHRGPLPLRSVAVDFYFAPRHP